MHEFHHTNCTYSDDRVLKERVPAQTHHAPSLKMEYDYLYRGTENSYIHKNLTNIQTTHRSSCQIQIKKKRMKLTWTTMERVSIRIIQTCSHWSACSCTQALGSSKRSDTKLYILSKVKGSGHMSMSNALLETKQKSLGKCDYILRIHTKRTPDH